jgi:hypothetical protein
MALKETFTLHTMRGREGRGACVPRCGRVAKSKGGVHFPAALPAARLWVGGSFLSSLVLHTRSAYQIQEEQSVPLGSCSSAASPFGAACRVGTIWPMTGCCPTAQKRGTKMGEATVGRRRGSPDSEEGPNASLSKMHQVGDYVGPKNISHWFVSARASPHTR